MREYWSQVFRRAFSEAWHLVANQPIRSAASYLVVFVIAAGLQWYLLGRKTMMEQVNVALTILGAAVIVGLVIVVIKLIAVPPALHEEQQDILKATNTEKEKIAHELERERETNRPNLQGSIQQFISADVSEGAHLILLMTIKNSGAPSIVEGYRIHAQMGQFSIQGRAEYLPDGLQLLGDKEQVLKILHSSDAIYEKTVKPIERGGMARGYLRYLFPGMKWGQFPKGTAFTVTFYDVLNKPYEARYMTAGDGNQELLYFPGAEPFLKKDQLDSKKPIDK